MHAGRNVVQLLLAALVTQSLGAQSDSRRITGVVVDSASGAPVDGAWVEAVGVRQHVHTDGSGRFVLTAAGGAVYRLVVRAIGYRATEQRVDLRLGDAAVRIALVSAPLELPALSVSAEADPGPSLRAVSASTTLSEAGIAESRGQTLGETLRSLPGVTTIQFGPSISKPVIRGLHSQRIVVLNSGVRQEGQQWGTEHAPEIDTFEVDQITVIRGSGAVLYGSDALGGVVKADRPPVPTEGGWRGDLAMNAFSNNWQGAMSGRLEAGDLKAPVLGRVGLRLRLTGRKAGDARTPDYTLTNTAFTELNGSAAIGVTRSWGSSELLYSRFSTELGVYSGAHVGTYDDLIESLTRPPRTGEFSYDIARPNQKVSHDLVVSRTSLTPSPGSRLDLEYGFQHNHRREYDSHGPLRTRNVPAFDLTLYTHTADVRYQPAPLGKLMSRFGVSGMWQDNHTDGKGFLIPAYRLLTGALYAQEDLVLDRWTLSAGARLDHRWQETLAYGDVGIVSPRTETSWTGVAGSAGVSYLLGRGWSAALQGSSGWRPPSVNERFAQGVHHGSAIYELGDTSLTPERKYTAEFSLRHAGQALRLEVTGYASRIDDFIFLRPTAPVVTIRGVFPGYRYDHTDAALRGAEASMAWSPTSRWGFQAGATVVRGTDLTRGSPLYDMPQDRLILSARRTVPLRQGGAWFAEIGGTLVRKQDRVPDQSVYTLPTDGYALVNLEAGTTHLHTPVGLIDVSLGIRNLFNTRYRDYLSRYRLWVDDPGRDVALRLRVPFGRW